MRQLSSVEFKRLRHFAKFCDIGGDETCAEKFRRYVAFCRQTGMPQIAKNRFMAVASQLNTDNTFIVLPTTATPVRSFVKARLQLMYGEAISKSDLYAAFVDWAGGKVGRVTHHTFMVRFNALLREDNLTNKVYTVQSHNGIKARHFKGIAFK